MDKKFYFHFYRDFYIEYSPLADTPPATLGGFHLHNLGELIIVEEGASTVISDGMIKSVAGSYAIYYPPHAIHQQLNAPNYKYTRWLITIEPAYLDGLDFPDSTFVLNLTADNLRRLVEPAKLLLFYSGDEKNVDRKLVEARRRSIVGLMLIELSDMLSGGRVEVPVGANYISGVCRYIDQHLSENLTLDELAERFFVSRAKLTQNFRGALGMSVGEYIAVTRVGTAKHLLKSGKSVSETAVLCGFTDSSHLIRTFSRLCGETPAVFRAKNHKDP